MSSISAVRPALSPAAALETLGRIVDERGSIPTVRCSSAQAKGAAKKYAYWGAARGELRRTVKGHLTVVSVERASSDRRSERLAEQDADSIADREGRMWAQRLGPVDASLAVGLLREVALELGEGC